MKYKKYAGRPTTLTAHFFWHQLKTVETTYWLLLLVTVFSPPKQRYNIPTFRRLFIGSRGVFYFLDISYMEMSSLHFILLLLAVLQQEVHAIGFDKLVDSEALLADQEDTDFWKNRFRDGVGSMLILNSPEPSPQTSTFPVSYGALTDDDLKENDDDDKGQPSSVPTKQSSVPPTNNPTSYPTSGPTKHPTTEPTTEHSSYPRPQ